MPERRPSSPDLLPEASLSTPVKLVLQAAEEIRVERGESELDAVHLLAGFARRHRELLAGRLGGIDVERYVSDRLGDREHRNPADPVVRRSVEMAKADGRPAADLRHLAESLAATYGLAPAATKKADAAPAPPRPTPTLDRLGRDLVALARAGQLNRPVGRQAEIDEVVEVLCRRLKRNPLLVGPPGVGKTAVVEGLAQRIAADEVPPALSGVRVLEITTAGLIAETKNIGDFTGLVDAIMKEASHPRVVLYVDEFQAAVEIGGRDLGLAAQMKPALARGELACIGALTESDYYRTVAADPALDRRFEPIRVQELDERETIEVLRSVIGGLSDRKLVVADETLEAIVGMCSRYLHNRHFPDKAIDVLDRAVARASIRGGEPDKSTVADVVADMTGLPLGGGAQDLATRLDGLGEFLRSRVIGQDAAIETICRHLPLKVRGLDLRPERPNGVFLFTGPTGVGKTELARLLAEYLFGSSERMVRLDMSEYSEAHYAAKLVGSPPGYVGYEQGAPLLEEIASRPFSVVLLDEIEKAHPQVHRLFLQVFDEGFMTSGAGHRVYFSDAIIVMTANVDVRATHRRAGFTGGVEEETALTALDAHFPREFVNRIDAICAFRALGQDDVERIVREVVLPGWLETQRANGLELEVDGDVVALLARRGYSDELGAREVHRVVEDELLGPVSRIAPAGSPCRLRASLHADEVVVSREDADVPNPDS